MSGRSYSGPVIDAHHHLWDLRLGKHPWLAPSGRGDGLAPLRRNYLVDDYIAVSTGRGIVATVHVEANWDPADPLGEIEWLGSLDKPGGIAARHVAYAALGDPRTEELLERLAAHRQVAGVREIVSWHPDPAKTRVTDPDILRNSVWRRNLGLLARHDFSFDLLISPWQLEAARQLAEDFPNVRFILNHCGSPMDRDPEGMDRWRLGLRALAEAPNVVVKLSDPVAYDPQWTGGSLAEVILHCIDCFGPQRCMFASDYPVSALHIGFDEWLTEFDAIVAGFSEDEKQAMFFTCAREVYSVPV